MTLLVPSASLAARGRELKQRGIVYNHVGMGSLAARGRELKHLLAPRVEDIFVARRARA